MASRGGIGGRGTGCAGRGYADARPCAVGAVWTATRHHHRDVWRGPLRGVAPARTQGW